ncbi:MAG: hypothetical protein WCI02_02445 [Planctomycetota bacterium]
MTKNWLGEPGRKWTAKDQIAATIYLYLMICIATRLFTQLVEWLIPEETETPKEDDDSEFWNGGDFYGG